MRTTSLLLDSRSRLAVHPKGTSAAIGGTSDLKRTDAYCAVTLVQ